ncbi:MULTISPECIES: hypothetical protein [Streptococcus]|uniref:Uncharacterized protein n=1 Tax=Streptococcus ruminantium TaxID=1917441 RepID=A0ABU1B3K1_9STRE|nr:MULTISPECIES: hypothetical protein [Streptococcus]MDQ8758404.1 hypothetical protein [Streptococcus ruminantium]MDQ8764668.1 hypothetical protein [Streptococcus ruminantium]MDQ8766505.1 hypothetical protein [Streptococcus ruminantium]MDQ8768916.1 hypothetical protein [Streptococcus ruminantium]MDQ8773867.1 hypothetical protein [Streptococcus ruminantium]
MLFKFLRVKQERKQDFTEKEKVAMMKQIEFLKDISQDLQTIRFMAY